MVGQAIACFSFTFQTGSFDPPIHMPGVVQMTCMPTTATTQVVEVVAWVVPRHFHRLLQSKNNIKLTKKSCCYKDVVFHPFITHLVAMSKFRVG